MKSYGMWFSALVGGLAVDQAIGHPADDRGHVREKFELNFLRSARPWAGIGKTEQNSSGDGQLANVVPATDVGDHRVDGGAIIRDPCQAAEDDAD